MTAEIEKKTASSPFHHTTMLFLMYGLREHDPQGVQDAGKPEKDTQDNVNPKMFFDPILFQINGEWW